MHAMIRRDEGAAVAAEALERAGRRLAAEAGNVPGFISHAVIATDDGALMSISFCENVEGLKAIDQLLSAWLAERLPASRGRPPSVSTGEVIVQKGL